MNTKEIFLNALAEINKDGLPFRVQLHCVVNEAMEIPDSVRTQNPNQIMFRLSSDLHPNIFYDFESRTFSFDCTFNHNPTRVYMNIDNIGAVVDDLDNSTMVFGFLQEPQSQVVQPRVSQPTKQNIPAKQGVSATTKTHKSKMVPPSQKPKSMLIKKHLSLVVDNT